MLNKERYLNEGFFIEKEWFELESVRNFSTTELRLLILHSGRTIEELDVEEKQWVLGGRNKKVSEIDKAKDKLIDLGLIELYDDDKNTSHYSKVGLGNYEYVPFTEIEKVKNLRQLLIVCALSNNKELIISHKLLKDLFGTETRRINENWKRTCKQLEVDVLRVQAPNKGGVRLVVPSGIADFNVDREPIKKHIDIGSLDDRKSLLLSNVKEEITFDEFSRQMEEYMKN